MNINTAGNTTLQTTAGSLIFNALNLTTANTLALTSANNITFNGAVAATTGTVALSAANSAQSITTGASGSFNVYNFDLVGGQWYQVGTVLPSFATLNSFHLNTSGVQFVRAANSSAVNIGQISNPYQIFDIYKGIGSRVRCCAILLNNSINAGT